MKKYLLIVIILLLGIIQIQSQGIGYEYDKAGNVKYRKIIPMSTRSVTDTTTITRNIFEDKEVNVRIYPNPTKGLLKVSVDNLENHENMTVLLYDLVGRLLINTKKEGSEIELDLTQYQNGTYILRLVRGKEKSEWKIIKN